MKKGKIDPNFESRMIKQEQAAEQTLQGLLWSSSFQGVQGVLEDPETPSFDLAPEEELDFGGRQ